MTKTILNNLNRMNKTQLVIASIDEEPDDRTYWLSKSAAKRFEHIEMLRALNYGAKASSRLQRFFEVAELSQS
jgi:hypothetical protein